MSTEVAALPILPKKMKVDGGGDVNDGVRNEKSSRKRKSEELMPTSISGSSVPKKARKWKHRFKTKRSKFPKKPRSVDGDAPKRKKIVRRRRMTESFNAPFNSTQFIMNDHVDEAVKHLNSTLNMKQKEVKNNAGDESESDIDYTMERPMRRITRARESSFSIDSDEDYYYSSPEDEEEFVNKEFIKDYDSVRNDRLIDMSKDELINEYLQMEQRIEALEKRLSSKGQEEEPPKPMPDETMSDTIKHFQKEIYRLESENSQLKKAHSSSNSCTNSSCSDSSSDSSDSSGSSSDNDSDQEEVEDLINDAQITIENSSKLKIKKILEDVDTGYESGQSNKKSGIDPNEEKEVVVNNEDDPEETEPKSDSISVNCITSTSQS